MFYAVDDSGKRVSAKVDKTTEVYKCLCCNEPVIHAKGQVNRPYFRHDKPCPYSLKAAKTNSMSKFHRDYQDAFYSRGADLEVIYGNNIADVVYKGFIYEIQHSAIKQKDIENRNKNYKNVEGITNVRWIINGESKLNVNHFEYCSKTALVIIIYASEERYVAKCQGVVMRFKYTSIEQVIYFLTSDNVIKCLRRSLNTKVVKELRQRFFKIKENKYLEGYPYKRNLETLLAEYQHYLNAGKEYKKADLMLVKSILEILEQRNTDFYRTVLSVLNRFPFNGSKVV